MHYAPSTLAENLERHLGDPDNPAIVFSFARCAELDAQEKFPDAICDNLREWGVQRYYVPVQYGGALIDFEQALQLIRMVARRDLTVAIGHGKTFLGGVCAWVSAESGQARRLAERILAGDAIAWGLTEREHGSDLLAGEVVAELAPDGYHINGEKWLINNATRGTMISLLARSKAEGGPRGFDMLLIDKQTLADDCFQYLPKETTHGIRGADISGIVFKDAHVPADAVIGASGSGLETVLKGLQLTRTLCASLSLGAGDHALRLAMRFAKKRCLYDKTLITLPRARRVLLNAYADHLLAEAMALVGTRSIQAMTEEMSVTSAIIKYLVPSRTDSMISILARFLGGRSFLVDADTYADGMFQKVQRDHRIVGLFDGNTLVNLNAIINEFPTLARAYCRNRGKQNEKTKAALETVFNLSATLPAFDPGRLTLISRQGASVLSALPDLLSRLTELAAQRPSLVALLSTVQRLLVLTDALHQRIGEQQQVRVHVPLTSFELAQQYALCYAAVAALGLWLGTQAQVNDAEVGSIWHSGHWLKMVLARVLTALGENTAASDEAINNSDADEAMLAHFIQQESQGLLFSLLPCRLAQTDQKEQTKAISVMEDVCQ